MASSEKVTTATPVTSGEETREGEAKSMVELWEIVRYVQLFHIKGIIFNCNFFLERLESFFLHIVSLVRPK